MVHEKHNADDENVPRNDTEACLCGHRIGSTGEETRGMVSCSFSGYGSNDDIGRNAVLHQKSGSNDDVGMLLTPSGHTSGGAEAPFVYLSPPNNSLPPSLLLSMNQEQSDGNDENGARHRVDSPNTTRKSGGVGNHHDGFLHTLNHETNLSHLATKQRPKAVEEKVSVDFVCRLCLERLEGSMQSNIHRLRSERKSYVDAVAMEEERERGIRRALAMNVGLLQGRNNDDGDGDGYGGFSQQAFGGDELLSSTLEAYGRDVVTLDSAVKDYEEELRHLHELWEEQTKRATELHQTRLAIVEERNALEIQARNFDGVLRHLTSQVHTAHLQVAQLERVDLFGRLFPIVVAPANGRRRAAEVAPATIHGLRLWHCPSAVAAHGTLTWEEIGAAWSQACQALLFVSAVTQFQSEEFRLVPTAACAKIIQLTTVSPSPPPNGDEEGQRRQQQRVGGEVTTTKKKRVVHHLGIDSEYDTRSSKRQDSMLLALCAFYAFLYELINHVTPATTKREEQKMLVPMADRSTIGRIHLPTLLLSNVQNGEDEWWEAIHGVMTNVKWLLEGLPKDSKI